jgi:hypothetical protein
VDEYPIALDFYDPLQISLYDLDEIEHECAQDGDWSRHEQDHDWRQVIAICRPKYEAVIAYCTANNIVLTYNQDP